MIYVATWGSYVKIGSSEDPRRRLLDLPHGSVHTPDVPGRPELVGWVNGDLDGEKMLHAALAPYRVFGEWFDAGSASVQRVVAEARRHPDGPSVKVPGPRPRQRGPMPARQPAAPNLDGVDF